MSGFYSEPATKADVRRAAIEAVGVRAELREMKKNMAARKDVERILGAIESLAAKSERAERANVLHGQAPAGVQVKQRGRERRIKPLETRPTRQARTG
jgi:hypothetical protein